MLSFDVAGILTNYHYDVHLLLISLYYVLEEYI